MPTVAAPRKTSGRRSPWSLLFKGRRATRSPRTRWGLLVAALVFVVLLAATLTALPLTSDDLTARLRREIDMRLPPELGLSLERASLALSRQGVVVDIDAVSLSDPTASIASIRTLRVTLDPVALLAQRIEPSQLIFDGPEIVLPDTRRDVGFNLTGEAMAAALSQFGRAIAALEAGFGDTSITVTDAALQMPGGTRLEGIEISARRDTLTGRIEIDANDATRRLHASIEGRGAERRYRLDLSVADEIIAFGKRVPKEFVLENTVLRVDAISNAEGFSGEALFRAVGIGPDGRPFGLELPCRLRSAECAIVGGRIDYGLTRGTVDGAVGYADGLTGAPRFALSSGDVVLAEADGVDIVEDVRLELIGSLLPDRPGVVFDIARVLHEGAVADLDGTIAFVERSPALDLTVKTTKLGGDLAKHLWPRFLAQRTRGWVLDHVGEGRVGPIDARIVVEANAIDDANDGAPLPDGAIVLDVPFEAASFDYVTGLPEITDAAGRVSFRTRMATIELDSGRGLLDGGSSGKLEAATFTIENVRAQPLLGALEARFAIEASEVYALHGPLAGTIAALPKDMTGDIDATLSLRLPLQGDIPREAIYYDLAADIRNGTLPDVYDGRALENADVALRANTAGFDLGGSGTLAGLPVELALFGSPETGIEAITASITDDVAAFGAINIDLTDYIDGTITARVAGSDPKAGIERLTVDFTDASVALPVRGTIKASGARATLVASVEPVDSGISLRRLTVDATSFRARGQLDVSASGNIDLRLSDYVIGQDDSGSLALATRGDSTSLVLDAASLDARPILDWLFASGEGVGAESGSSTSLAATAGRVIGYDGNALTDLDLQLDVAGTTPSLLSASAQLAGGGPVRASIRRGEGRGIISLTAANAGEALRFVDIYERLQGGELGIEASLSDEGATFGNLSIWDFEIADEVGLEVLTKDADADRRTTMAFDRLRVPFSHANGRIEIGEGFVRGPVAGATFTGGLDLRADTVAIRGTFVPLYILNNVFSRVPIVGAILGGRKREGLWGLTFAMDGPIAGPTLRVNPLSAIAPGMFRQIFEFGPASE